VKIADLLPADLIRVARVQRQLCGYRAVMALVVAPISVPTLGIVTTSMWFALIVFCESLTWVTTRSARHYAMTQRQLLAFFVSGTLTVPAWTLLGVLFWLSGRPDATNVAIAFWAAQLIYTQRFVYQSMVAIVVGNTPTVLAMLLLPLCYPRFELSMQATFVVGVFIAIAFTVSGALRTFRTVSTLARQKAAVEYGATHDTLTKLLNRDQLQQHLRDTLQAGEPCAVLFLDLDRFKQVNDTLGHQAGDALLQEFSCRLKSAAPDDARVARFGGDEFAVLVKAAEGQTEIDEICRRVLEAVDAPFSLPRGFAHVGASIGVAVSPGDGNDPGELMRKADIALYAAKAGGRGHFRIFSPDLDGAVRDRADLEDDLRNALASNSGLELHYQPKVDAEGKTRAVEALLRWPHPRLGDVSPTRILAVAEETGLIIPLGHWVLAEGIGFAKRWPDLEVAINISPAQLQEADFSAWLTSLAIRMGVAPARIELEVTETVLLDESAHTSNALNALRSAGFRIALDDFGTGYSSLRHLHRFAVDRVKIDQSFVRHLEDSNEAAAIVQAVIQLGHAMGLQVTAEGVETRQHEAFLNHAGIDEMQGFLFSKARSEADLAGFIADKTVHRRAA